MVLYPSSPQEGEGIKAILDTGNIIPLETRIVIDGKSVSMVLSEHDWKPWAYCLGGLGGVWTSVKWLCVGIKESGNWKGRDAGLSQTWRGGWVKGKKGTPEMSPPLRDSRAGKGAVLAVGRCETFYGLVLGWFLRKAVVLVQRKEAVQTKGPQQMCLRDIRGQVLVLG